MTPPPAEPKLYHITHVDNLPRIFESGSLLCDRVILQQGGPAAAIGMSHIKQRRVEILEVDCHPGTKVGDYVPFYFCPRSVMLYVIHCANSPDLPYQGGQVPIVHLVADLRAVVAWANAGGVRWAFSLSNAGSYYAEFRAQMEHLGDLDWGAIKATDFRAAQVKEHKQAEFLVEEGLPVRLIEQVGVRSSSMRERAEEALKPFTNPPEVEVRPGWYY